jgi:hypothetical protein
MNVETLIAALQDLLKKGVPKDTPVAMLADGGTYEYDITGVKYEHKITLGIPQDQVRKVFIE